MQEVASFGKLSTIGVARSMVSLRARAARVCLRARRGGAGVSRRCPSKCHQLPLQPLLVFGSLPGSGLNPVREASDGPQSCGSSAALLRLVLAIKNGDVARVRSWKLPSLLPLHESATPLLRCIGRFHEDVIGAGISRLQVGEDRVEENSTLASTRRWPEDQAASLGDLKLIRLQVPGLPLLVHAVIYQVAFPLCARCISKHGLLRRGLPHLDQLLDVEHRTL